MRYIDKTSNNEKKLVVSTLNLNVYLIRTKITSRPQ